MSKSIKNNQTDTGCTRPESIFGLWIVEGRRFEQMVDVARSIDLVALAEKRRARADTAPGSPLPTLAPESPGKKKPSADYDDGDGSDEQQPDQEPPYRICNGVALFSCTGLMTKYQTSFQDILGGTSTMSLRRSLRAAAADPLVTAGCICFDTPGGTVAGITDLADDIRAFAAVKTIHAYASDQCCSAGLFAACACDKIFANATAVIGSIGAVAVLKDTSGAYKQQGVVVHVVTNDAPAGGTVKGAGTDGTPITDAQLTDFKRHINEMNELFVADVARGRNLSLDRVRAMADGRVHVGSNALALGLIDGVCSFDECLQNLYTETLQMNSTEFAAFAAANPTDPMVVKLHAQGTAAGTAGGASSARNELAEMLAAFPGREKFAAEQFAKGHSLLTAKANLADELQKENEVLRTQAAQNSAALAAGNAAGTGTLNAPLRLPTATAAANARAGDTPANATAAWEDAVTLQMKNGSMSRESAMAHVASTKPNLHEDYLAAYNAEHADWRDRDRMGRSRRA